MIFKNDDVAIYSKYLLCTNITSFCVHQFGFTRKRGRLINYEDAAWDIVVATNSTALDHRSTIRSGTSTYSSSYG